MGSRFENIIDSKKENKLVGTIYYMAPQVIQKQYDQRCDIWSLGVLLYILVSGIPPFDGQNDKEIMQNIKRLSYTFKCSQMRQISADLKNLISRILVPENQRISIDEIISHPWMNRQQSCKPLLIDFNKMRQFSQFSKVFFYHKKMKKVVMTYIASQLPQKRIHQLGLIFKHMDKDNNGLLTTDQMKKALEQQQNKEISYKQLMQILTSTDTDQNGKINYNEFITACLEGSYYNDENYLKRVFDYFDVNKDGAIDYDEFKQILFSADPQSSIDDQQIDEIIKSADLNKDGKIDYHEFINSMRSREYYQ